jgi:hypothetical protein
VSRRVPLGLRIPHPSTRRPRARGQAYALVAAACLAAAFAAPGAPAGPAGAPPLPEEARLKDPSPVGETCLILQPRDSGEMIGWRQVKIHKAALDGKPVYWAAVDAGLADTKQGDVRRRQERSLWTHQAKLIRASVVEKTAAGARRLEIAWDAGHVTLKRIGGASSAPDVQRLPCPEPPDPDTDILAFLAPFEPETPRAVRVVDSERGTVEQGRLEPQSRMETTIAIGKKRMTYEVLPVRSTLRGGVEWEFVSGGRCIGMRCMAAPLQATDAGFWDLPLHEIRRTVYSQPAVLKAFINRARAAWRQAGGAYENPLLGLSFTLPKGWKTRSDKPADDVTTLSLSSALGDVLFDVVAEQLGDDLPLKEVARPLVESEVLLNPEAVTQAEVRLGNVPAIRLAYTHTMKSGDNQRVTHIAVQGGCRLQLQAVWLSKKPALHNDLALLLSSIRWTEPKRAN